MLHAVKCVVGISLGEPDTAATAAVVGVPCGSIATALACLTNKHRWVCGIAL